MGGSARRDVLSVTVLIRSGDGRVTVDEHTRTELPGSGLASADVVVVAEDTAPCWARLVDRDRELASAHPGALVTVIACGPDLALVRLGSSAPGSARRTNTAAVWPVYASILHALTVWEVAPR
ncbi:hypothetical protein [Embleya sp. NPDC005575]|uniref:hypothetical protein n=1 Tax=Embleya sp. NPDC005575 TaxID=3156892 RepID=UPI0033AE0CC1